MSTNFKSQEVIANLNSKDLFVKFTDLNNLKDYLPSDVEEFESIKSQIPFNMFCHISENDKNSSKVSIEINMELNFMMKMLVQKPINIFLDRFTEIIKKV